MFYFLNIQLKLYILKTQQENFIEKQEAIEKFEFVFTM